ncbi:MAG: TraR/DksA C4-type zinc finger protein [Ferruginibacter sp.]
MATKKPAVKAIKKPTPKKAVAKPTKKAVPAKTPAAKVSKPVKPVAKASRTSVGKGVKTAAKPVAKPAVKPSHSKPGKSAKQLPKSSIKKIEPQKGKPVKSVGKSQPVKNAKPLLTPATKKPAAAQKPVNKPMAKKIEVTKPVAKAATKMPVLTKTVPKNIKDIKIAPAKPVVIPKISHKSSRKYQPEFTKSVLDQARHDPGASIIRYSDNDLAEFRELIQRKLGAAKKELSYLQGLITRKDEMGGDESDNRYMTMEDGSLSMEREQLSQMASRQITFIDHLEKALMRIENKTYGICRVTGKLIDKARLRAVPHATLSIEAKMGIAK